MALSIELILLWASALILAAVLASKASSRLGVPTLLLFLAIGMLAGSDGPGGIYFDDARLSQSLGVVALVFILFTGGLETDWKAVRKVLWKALSLSTVGVAITAVATGAFASWVLQLTAAEGFLLGAIVSSTDAAAVFSVLSAGGGHLKGRVRRLLELESGGNDPMAVLLTLAGIRFVTGSHASWSDLISLFVLQMAVGAIAGFLFGRLSVWLVDRVGLETEGLYPVLTIGLAALTYSATSLLEGSGFLAVYIAGVVLGNSAIAHKRSVLRFHDALAWLMQIAMFLTLGLLVFPSRLVPVAGVSLAITAFLMFVARPASVFASLALSGAPLKDQLLISWAGLRGAVPIILATFPMLAGAGKAQLFFDVVFFIVLASVLLQGTTLRWVARRLGLGGDPRNFHSLEKRRIQDAHAQ